MASVDNSQRQSMGNICQNYTGDYDPDRVYRFLDTVSFAYGSYLCRKNGIQGTAPTANKTDENWFCCSIAGVATPDYLAAHDRVMNAAQQTELDRAAVELSEQNVSSMETNIEQMQADVQTNAGQVARDKDSAAGYAQAAEVSRQAAETSEQNVAALVNGFDDHVSQKTTEATGTIETARQQAISVVQQQGAESVQGVIGDTEAYFDQKKAAALSEISDKTTEVVKSVTDEGTKQIGLVDAAGAAQVAAVTQEGADQIAGIQAEAESYVKREDANKLAFKGEYEGRSHHVEDSADWGFLGMQGFGESTQVQTTGAQLFDASKITKESYLSDTSGQVVSGGPTAVGENASDYIPIAGYDYVTVTTNMAEKRWGAFYGADKSFLQGIRGYGTLTIPEGAHYMRLTIADDALDTCMINEGDTALPWEPYTGGAPSPSTAYPQEI